MQLTGFVKILYLCIFGHKMPHLLYAKYKFSFFTASHNVQFQKNLTMDFEKNSKMLFWIEK